VACVEDGSFKSASDDCGATTQMFVRSESQDYLVKTDAALRFVSSQRSVPVVVRYGTVVYAIYRIIIIIIIFIFIKCRNFVFKPNPHPISRWATAAGTSWWAWSPRSTAGAPP
jgi:hypothetical protein